MSAASAPRRHLKWLTAGVVAAVAVGVAAWAQLGARRAPATAGFTVVAAYPHDPAAFTQGLAIEAGQLYEGTGQYGASTVRRVDLASGRADKQRALGPRYFGEGIAILDGLLYQLTWQNGVVVVYDLDTFEVERTMQYDGEGWGLTHDGRAAHHERRLGDDPVPRSRRRSPSRARSRCVATACRSRG